jgi:hypothetical protein
MRRRYAKTIATTRAASNPSRSMISKAASICSANLSPVPRGSPAALAKRGGQPKRRMWTLSTRPTASQDATTDEPP